jgi:excisionase family DNA binding protein
VAAVGGGAFLLRDILVTSTMRLAYHDEILHRNGQALTGRECELEAITATTEAERSPYFDYEEASAYCNLHRTTIWRAMRAGALRSSGPGSAVRFHKDDLDAWMRSRDRK